MWPRESLLPGYRAIIEEYMTRMGEVAARFLSLVAEAIGLPPDSFDQFFEPKGSRWKQQHKLKLVKYPDVGDLPPGSTTQGVGPHKGHLIITKPDLIRFHVIQLFIASNRSQGPPSPKLQWRMDRLSSYSRDSCRCVRTRYGSNHTRNLYFDNPSSDISSSRSRFTIFHPVLSRCGIGC
jgi:hypothetical protein